MNDSYNMNDIPELDLSLTEEEIINHYRYVEQLLDGYDDSIVGVFNPPNLVIKVR